MASNFWRSRIFGDSLRFITFLRRMPKTASTCISVPAVSLMFSSDSSISTPASLRS